MRNWNSCSFSYRPPPICDSHPTYEELKPMCYRLIKNDVTDSHPTYEELKLPITAIVFPKGPAFTSYLWGIETQVARQIWEGTWKNSHPTYEELKHIKVNLPYLLLADSHPTYEELKLTQRFVYLYSHINSHPTYEELKLSRSPWGPQKSIKIHILPMRNWNTASAKGGKNHVKDSHPTYEELKPFFLIPRVITDMHSHPTYEELKLYHIKHEGIGCHQFTSYLWGIETDFLFLFIRQFPHSHPTYEELKQDSFSRWLSHRNLFTSYLWGIETTLCLYVNDVLKMIHILPMRNWNDVNTLSAKTLEMIHILPMRNWNLGNTLTGLQQKLIHILPMRNWNEIKNRITELITTIHILPMRNWNKTVTSVKILKYLIHILPMRNWNLYFFCFYTHLDIFTSYLWGIETHLQGKIW